MRLFKMCQGKIIEDMATDFATAIKSIPDLKFCKMCKTMQKKDPCDDCFDGMLKRTSARMRICRECPEDELKCQATGVMAKCPILDNGVSMNKCNPIKCPHERCPANGDATLCPIVQNGVSMKVTDKRTNVLRLENLKAKQVFEYVNKGHTAHRSMYQVLERTQYLDKQPIGIYVLDLRTLKVCNHYPKKRVKLIEEPKTREMPKDLLELLKAVERLESMANTIGIEIPEMPPEIRQLFEMLELPEIKVVEAKSPVSCMECPIREICRFDVISTTCSQNKPKKKKAPSVGTIQERTVYEYIDQRKDWSQGVFIKLNQSQNLGARQKGDCSWVVNLTTSKLCHHFNRNVVRVLDAETVING